MLGSQCHQILGFFLIFLSLITLLFHKATTVNNLIPFKFMKYQLLIFSILLLAFSSCKPKQIVVENNTDRINRYFPEILGDLVFNLPFEEVLKKRPKLAPVNYVNDAFNFRKEYVEEINEAGIRKIVYYFDAEGEKPFYEAIFYYENETKLNSESIRLLGQPNYENNTEWILDSRQDYKIHAWKFENKLVVAAQLKGTEWGE